MWNLEERSTYVLVHRFEVPWAQTWADTRPGHTDKEKREQIREAAAAGSPGVMPKAAWWAFRIRVWKKGGRPFDIENVPKPIIDAFCGQQIRRDGSPHAALELYPDDTVDHVKMLQVWGDRTTGDERTTVEIYACIADSGEKA